MGEEDGEQVTAPPIVWVGLTFMAAVSFWCQATVTEERFVPALNVIATEYNIPDDVAGATLMAAGASSPELFSSIVALFITHSALGLGTIVGSEIFNQLIICAGAVYAARAGKLKLDKAILAREVGFYALSIVLLLCALQDKRPVEGDTEDHIFISFFEASYLFGGYILYVLVCANFDAIVAFFDPTYKERQSSLVAPTGNVEPGYGAFETTESQSKKISVDFSGMPFLHETYDHEPEDNFKDAAPSMTTLSRTPTGEARKEHVSTEGQLVVTDDGVKTQQMAAVDSDSSSIKKSLTRREGEHLLADSPIHGTYSDGASVREFRFIVNTEKPSDHHGLYDIEKSDFEETVSCFLWQRSLFYDKARFAVHGWHKRWFTFGHEKVTSVPDRSNFEKHAMTYPRFVDIEVDDARLIVRIINPDKNKRSYYFLAPNREIFETVVHKCEEIIQVRLKSVEIVGRDESDIPEGDADYEPSLIEFPAGAGFFAILVHCILFPLKLSMHITMPDVRHLDSKGNSTSSLNYAFLAIFSCLVWLIIGSYAMVTSLEHLAALMDIPDAVIGVTVSAAGTSLPNYIASKIAAEKGFGNMAVSNAFGSNTFNIMVGLGLPWLMYTSFGTGFEPYSGLRNEGIMESVIILGLVLLVFIITMFFSGFELHTWHGHLYVLLYAAYLAYVIADVYL
mmetsp:Transcript_6142/g.8704  ORF Transcript_6142/g.8704 Transcript_6142/m.8704 type:complete len:679 (+) Transcript_6142:42-2078(+)